MHKAANKVARIVSSLAQALASRDRKADGCVLADGPATRVLARADLLATTNVEPPQLVRLAQAIGLPAFPLTVEGFVTALLEHHSKDK